MKLKKMLAAVLTMAMVATALPVTAFADEPDLSGDVVNVTAETAQDVLDGKYGNITGKTINFTEDIEDVLDLARPTKYEGSETTYYNYVNSQLESESTAWSENISEVMNSHSHYYRTLEDVTFTAENGVTVKGFTFSAGHVASAGYDYVRDVEQTAGVTYYKHSSLDGITFEGLTITGQFDAKLYMEGCTVEGITFDGCTFTGAEDDGENAAIKFLADSQYFENITVKDCSIDGYYQGVFIQGVDGAVITDNAISNTEHNAIALQSHDVAAKGEISVKENYITNVSDRAIRFNAVDESAEIAVNNNIMVNCGDGDGQLIKAGEVADGASVDLESNYWDGKDVSTAVAGLTAPTVVGVTGGDWEDKDVSVSDYVAPGYRVENGEVVEATAVAEVNGVEYTDLQEAIKAAAPSGTVEIISDVTVDEWIMISQDYSIGSGQLITLNMDGLTIDGNGHTLTVNSVESATNGNFLFQGATNLNINDLTIKMNCNAGGITLQSGKIENVTFDGGNGVFPGTGDVTIEDCTFKTNGTAIYYEEARDNLTVTGNTFELEDDTNVILLRGDTKFTNNNIVSGRTVNVVSGSPVVTGNDFNDVRFKVYNDAEATIKDNTINELAFNDDSDVMSTFTDNTLSDEAQATLDDAGVINTITTPAPSTSSSRKSSKKYDVEVEDTEDGTVKVSSTRVKKGATVTITVTPDDGYELDELVVLDSDGDEIEVKDKGNGKFTFVMPRGDVEIEASFEEADEAPVVDEPAVDEKEENILILTIDQVIYQLNGEYLVNDVAPVIKGDRTMLPIRLIAEFLGVTVTWNEAEQSVTIVKDDTTIVIYIGQEFALVNGAPVQLDAPAFIANDRTYLPLRFVAENLGAVVTWNDTDRTVTVIG